MSKKITGTIKEIVEHNLCQIPENEVLQITARDYIYILRTLEEWMRYFHNPDHYQSIDDIRDFLGNKESGGAFEVLSTALYHKMYPTKISKELQSMIEKDVFESPLFPEYYK
jgi:hypothetical protein